MSDADAATRALRTGGSADMRANEEEKLIGNLEGDR